MAAALFRDRIRQRPDAPAWRVESAGTWAQQGMPASEGAVVTMRSRGLDLSSHRSRPINRGLAGAFDLILTMERGQKEALRAEFPELASRIWLLSEVAGTTGEVGDPYGQTEAAYQAAVRQIEQYLDQAQDNILEIASLPRMGTDRPEI